MEMTGVGMSVVGMLSAEISGVGEMTNDQPFWLPDLPAELIRKVIEQTDLQDRGKLMTASKFLYQLSMENQNRIVKEHR